MKIISAPETQMKYKLPRQNGLQEF